MTKKRIFIYFLFMAMVVFGVIVKQNTVTLKRNKAIVTTFSRWQEFGRPVVVENIKKEDVKAFVKITLVPVEGNQYEGFVPLGIKEQLSLGQNVFLTDHSSEAIGHITSVSEEIDIDSGMFRVEMSRDGEVAAIGGRMIVYVHTRTFESVIRVSNDVLDKEGEGHIVWVAENGRAQKRNVQVRVRNGYGAIIEKGLDAGDILIVQGFTQLSEGDRLYILNTLGSEGNKR